MSFIDRILEFFGMGQKPTQPGARPGGQPQQRPGGAPQARPAAAPAARPGQPASSAAGAGQARPAGGMKIDRVMVGESLVGEGNEVAHIDLIIGPRNSAAEAAFCNALTNNKDGFTSLLALVAPNLATKPNTLLYNKVTIKGAKQAVQMFGPAQRAVAMAVADCVQDGTIPMAEADDLFICAGIFIHWLAEDDNKIQDYNYAATKEALKRAIAGEPKASEVASKKGSMTHPFAAHA